MNYIIPFLILITIVVFIHEYGHYYFAKKYGVGITDFSIGFGREIFGWNDKRGTRWKISLLPFGGYVKMFGEDPFSKEKIPLSLSKFSFSNKKVYQRFLIVAAGPLANFLFAIICYTFLFTFIGKINTPPIVSSVEINSPAEIADIRKDDKILRINNKIVNNFYDIRKYIYLSKNDFINFEILRDNNVIVKNIKPTFDQKNAPKIGIYSSKPVITKYSFHYSLYLGTKETYEICSITLKGLHHLIIGKGSRQDIGGPLKIAELSGKLLEAGLLSFINLIIILSITIGLINLFPLPVLDGGHLTLYIIEILFGKPVNKNIQEIIFKIGFAIIITLAVFLTYNDIINLFKF